MNFRTTFSLPNTEVTVLFFPDDGISYDVTFCLHYCDGLEQEDVENIKRMMATHNFAKAIVTDDYDNQILTITREED